MFKLIPPYLYIALAITAAFSFLYMTIISIRRNVHYSIKLASILGLLVLVIAAIRKLIDSYLRSFLKYLDILGTIQLVLFLIALAMMFVIAFKFGDGKRKGLTIIALVFVSLFFGLYFYVTLFYKR